ncbi:hypothetical protein DIPPA_20704 [Diplonema papillatum]|nr:hypothetical protein DIPPA_20704 [Diplonema papillatum]
MKEKGKAEPSEARSTEGSVGEKRPCTAETAGGDEPGAYSDSITSQPFTTEVGASVAALRRVIAEVEHVSPSLATQIADAAACVVNDFERQVLLMFGAWDVDRESRKRYLAGQQQRKVDGVVNGMRDATGADAFLASIGSEGRPAPADRSGGHATSPLDGAGLLEKGSVARRMWCRECGVRVISEMTANAGIPPGALDGTAAAAPPPPPPAKCSQLLSGGGPLSRKLSGTGRGGGGLGGTGGPASHSSHNIYAAAGSGPRDAVPGISLPPGGAHSLPPMMNSTILQKAELCKAIASSLVSQLSALSESMQVQQIVLYAFDKTTSTLRSICTVPKHASVILPSHSGVQGLVFTTGVASNINKIPPESAHLFTAADNQANRATQAYLGFPVVGSVKGKLPLGILELVNKQDGTQWSADDEAAVHHCCGMLYHVVKNLPQEFTTCGELACPLLLRDVAKRNSFMGPVTVSHAAILSPASRSSSVASRGPRPSATPRHHPDASAETRHRKPSGIAPSQARRVQLVFRATSSGALHIGSGLGWAVSAAPGAGGQSGVAQATAAACLQTNGSSVVSDVCQPPAAQGDGSFKSHAAGPTGAGKPGESGLPELGPVQGCSNVKEINSYLATLEAAYWSGLNRSALSHSEKAAALEELQRKSIRIRTLEDNVAYLSQQCQALKARHFGVRSEVEQNHALNFRDYDNTGHEHSANSISGNPAGGNAVDVSKGPSDLSATIGPDNVGTPAVPSNLEATILLAQRWAPILAQATTAPLNAITTAVPASAYASVEQRGAKKAKPQSQATAALSELRSNRLTRACPSAPAVISPDKYRLKHVHHASSRTAAC